MNEQPNGHIALVLHAHLPYVRHRNRDDLMEERWFFEAMTETYIPLLDTFERLQADHVPFRITMTLTPTLLAMMADPLMQERYEQYLLRAIGLAEREIERNEPNEAFIALAVMYFDRWTRWLRLYREWERDVIARFRCLADAGVLEIITCAATHAFLPFIKHPASIYAQIETGMLEHERFFGQRPHGIWLPECAYAPHLSPLLKQCGVRYFVVDAHGIEHAEPPPTRGCFAPVQTADGVHAFARDVSSSQQVWSSHEGYPGDYDYREYYRDIGFDLGWSDEQEWKYIKPYMLHDGARMNTGIKYYRITSTHEEKEPYRPDWAKHKAYAHARHFLDSREQQLQLAATHLDRTPVVLCPYDAELFGHWWYEGPLWIEALFREQATRRSLGQSKLTFVAPIDYLEQYPQSEQAHIPFCTWGRDGYGDVWLQEHNDWIYKHLHQVETRLLHTIEQHQGEQWAFSSIQERILNQAVREFMLAGSSDWAFIIDANTVPSYATARTKQHVMRCHTLLDMIDKGLFDQLLLEQMEQDAPCFPTLDYRLLLHTERNHNDMKATHAEQQIAAQLFTESATAHLKTSLLHTAETTYRVPRGAMLKLSKQQRNNAVKRVLMLAWEFPPLIVGGLSRAVYDLSRHLVRRQCEVHIVTREVPGSPSFEMMSGIYVHRVPLIQTNTEIEFMDWVFQMNNAMSDGVNELVQHGISFDFIHAHDWLVYLAAKDLKDAYNWPLIATVHATEHGRNHGALENDLQRRIHDMELQLTNEAEHVIVCSSAMVHEVERLFGLARHKISMIPNGVERKAGNLKLHGNSKSTKSDMKQVRLQYAQPNEPMLFYIGRLVFEKGVHVLIEAMTHVVRSTPQAKLVIAGSGPMKHELQRLVKERHLDNTVHFAGFVNDDERDALLSAANVCVFPSLYEPFGIVALEAMQQGTPVVVSDTGGLAEIVEHEVDGFKALPGHVESLAWHITELINNRELAERMATRAQVKVQTQYDWHTIAVSTQRVYEGVIAR
ncbi:1,4-alpha-glucan branching protein domain-containing protein [Paenibacillus sp. 481]|uniref:1,4-alpha-glucan branching protein domain-containing protein n=1 Tax=Paenibacillus sp. 481 TaxID=2835869 RepID=UPI001E4A34AC|nr:1,4-alpha-glucan branching protein domain-containing protein [Paenibacillus sp. 481]UHA72272.1 DUF1957 domain-containing protein [Paenibacillus sp. 481]